MEFCGDSYFHVLEKPVDFSVLPPYIYQGTLVRAAGTPQNRNFT